MRPLRVAAVCLAVVFAGINLLAEDSSGDKPSLELALELVGASHANFYVGELPTDLIDIVYLPPGGEVVGSVVRSYHANILVDFEMASDQVLARLEQSYESAGWTNVDRGEGRGGFIPHTEQDRLSYCRGPDWVNFRPVSDGDLTRLVVRVSQQDYDSCAYSVMGEAVDGTDFPVLQAPPDTPIAGMGGGGSGNDREVRARIKTDLSTAGLIAHYAQQVEADGWQPEAGCADGPLGIALWSKQKQDDLLSAFLILRERPDATDAVFRIASGREKGQFRD